MTEEVGLIFTFSINNRRGVGCFYQYWSWRCRIITRRLSLSRNSPYRSWRALAIPLPIHKNRLKWARESMGLYENRHPKKINKQDLVFSVGLHLGFASCDSHCDCPKQGWSRLLVFRPRPWSSTIKRVTRIDNLQNAIILKRRPKVDLESKLNTAFSVTNVMGKHLDRDINETSIILKTT